MPEPPVRKGCNRLNARSSASGGRMKAKLRIETATPATKHVERMSLTRCLEKRFSMQASYTTQPRPTIDQRSCIDRSYRRVNS
jgi:hypothetical protein